MEDAINWEAADVIGVLAKSGVDVNGVNSLGRPFVYLADDNDSDIAVKALFDNGARPIAIVNGKPLPPVWIGMRSPAALDLFLEHGLDPNLTDERGITLLMRAAGSCRTASVRNLIARGARLDPKDADGDTALTLARSDGCTDVVNVLVQHGGNE